MEGVDAGEAGVRLVFRDVEGGADLDVFLRKIVSMDEHFADLVGVVGVFAVFGVVALGEEAGIAALNDRRGVGLDFVHHAEDFRDLGAERRLGAEENVAVRVGGLVTVVHELGVGADLAVVAGDEFQEAQHAALVHGAEDKGRGRAQQALFDVLAEADEAFLEIARLRLLDLPDVEIDEAHREHVVGEEGELVFTVRVVRLEGVPKKGDVLLLVLRLKRKWQII